MSDQCSNDIATIACDLNDNPTTAQLLLALAAAWRGGHAAGIAAGATMTGKMIEMATEAMFPKARVLADAKYNGARAKVLP